MWSMKCEWRRLWPCAGKAQPMRKSTRSTYTACVCVCVFIGLCNATYSPSFTCVIYLGCCIIIWMWLYCRLIHRSKHTHTNINVSHFIVTYTKHCQQIRRFCSIVLANAERARARKTDFVVFAMCVCVRYVCSPRRVIDSIPSCGWYTHATQWSKIKWDLIRLHTFGRFFSRWNTQALTYFIRGFFHRNKQI